MVSLTWTYVSSNNNDDDDDDRWKCSSCQQMVCAKKQLTVYSAPNVCTVQFKR